MHIRTLVKPLTLFAFLALLLSLLPLLEAWRMQREAGPADAAERFVVRQNAWWVAGTVLATTASVTLVFLLFAAASSVPSPWRRALSVVVYILSPVLALYLTFVFNALFTLPYSQGLTAVFMSPGWLIKFSPSALTLAALPFLRAPHSIPTGPA